MKFEIVGKNVSITEAMRQKIEKIILFGQISVNRS